MLRRWPLLVLAFGLVVVLVSCAGRGGVSISVSPSEVTLAPGESVVFTAVVIGGAGTGVEWSSSGGVLVPSGLTAVFSAPAEVGEYTVMARSAQDRGRWASAVVTVAGGADGGGYPYGDGVELGEDGLEFVGEGVWVSLPRARDGAVTLVEVAVLDALVGVAMPLSGLTRVVALRFSGDLELAGASDDSPPVLRLALEPIAAGPVAVSASADASVFAVAWVRVGEGEWVPLAGVARWDDVAGAFLVSVAHPLEACVGGEDSDQVLTSCEFAWQVVDAGALVAVEDAIEVEASGSGLVARSSTMRTATGLYQVNLDAFVAAGASCEVDRLPGFLTHENERASWVRSARTAVVFVHGWQSLAGWLKKLAGDEPLALPAHCSNWESFLAGIAGAGGPWAWLRSEADVFTFRYNSNRRVTENGAVLAGWLPELRLLGYERVLLVSHSMGGLVVHDARERVFADGRSGLGPVDLPVITLATPYMGGPLLCTEVSGGFCQAADSSLLTAVWGVVPIAGMPSTLDLSTALSVSAWQRLQMGHQDWLGLALPYERNPYLLRLWEPVNMRDSNLTAFVGNSGLREFFPSLMYELAVGALRPGWGRNDGIVPLASGLAAMDLAFLNPPGRLANVFEFGRDHGYMISGCGDHLSGLCPVGAWTDDVYLDAVAERMLAYTLVGDGDISVEVAPESVTLVAGGSQEFTATVSGTASTLVTWSATCGSVSGSGNTVAYTAPESEGTCLVRATSVADEGAWDEATVTVTAVDGDLRPLRNSIAAGVHHSLAILEDGTVMAWGANIYGELGIVNADGPEECWYQDDQFSAPCSMRPVRVPGLEGIVSVAAGWSHSVALDASGSVWTWGWNHYGQIGNGSRTQDSGDVHSPYRVPGLTDVVAIGAGSFTTLAVRADGTVWVWGSNRHGQLAMSEDTWDVLSPVQVAGISGAVGVVGGDFHTIVMRADGTVWAWGFYLGLGVGATENVHTPTRVSGLSDVVWLSVDTASYSAYARTGDGRSWWWGWGLNLCHGHPRTEDVEFPTEMSVSEGVVRASLGSIESVCAAVRDDGSVVEWGFDYSDGEHGKGAVWRESPVVVPEISGARDIVGSYYHHIAVTEAGDLYAWGIYNTLAWLGTGDQEGSVHPVKIDIGPVLVID